MRKVVGFEAGPERISEVEHYQISKCGPAGKGGKGDGDQQIYVLSVSPAQ